jgi:hypothetical protein
MNQIDLNGFQYDLAEVHYPHIDRSRANPVLSDIPGTRNNFRSKDDPYSVLGVVLESVKYQWLFEANPFYNGALRKV